MHFKKTSLLFILTFVVLAAAISRNIRGDYRSGDELGFITNFEQSGGDSDHRYLFWIKYIALTTSINETLPLIINLFLFLFLMKRVVDLHVFPPWVLVSMTLLPTSFYFLNTYLRDIAFMLYALLVISQLASKSKSAMSRAVLLIGFVIVTTMRPVYGLILFLSWLFSLRSFAKFSSLIAVGGIAVFLLTPVILVSHYETYACYRDFFVLGHLRGKEFVGVTSIPIADFTPSAAAFNFLVSPLFFWLIPCSGFGSQYDRLLYIENSFFLVLIILAVLRIRLGSKDRIYRFCLFGSIFSFFMAAATTTHDDSYRFRLMFIPFVTYLAVYRTHALGLLKRSEGSRIDTKLKLQSDGCSR